MSDLPLQFHPEARVDLREAFAWYAEKGEGIAESFLQDVEAAINSVQRSPLVWAQYLYGTRRYLMRKFPYVIIFRVADVRIEVIAISHGHRKPGHWRGRLEAE